MTLQIQDKTLWAGSVQVQSVLVSYFKYMWSWIFLILISLGIMWFQVSNVDVLDSLQRYNTIRSNLGNWTNAIQQVEFQEKNKNSDTVFATRSQIKNWQCYDSGSYYIPIRLGKESLPESIRRGLGDAWKVSKGVGPDPAALQFCQYLIRERSNETIQCGLDAFNKTGNSGLFDPTHWCRNDWSRLVRSLTI